MAKAGTALKNLPADDLGTPVVREVFERSNLKPEEIDR